MGYWSEDPKRYYDKKAPLQKGDIGKAILSAFSKTSYSKNEIISVQYIADNIVDIETSFICQSKVEVSKIIEEGLDMMEQEG